MPDMSGEVGVDGPFSTPKESSKGLPVSLQMGKGMYSSCPCSFVI